MAELSTNEAGGWVALAFVMLIGESTQHPPKDRPYAKQAW
jgi:hypothetical protein